MGIIIFFTKWNHLHSSFASSLVLLKLPNTKSPISKSTPKLKIDNKLDLPSNTKSERHQPNGKTQEWKTGNSQETFSQHLKLIPIHHHLLTQLKFNSNLKALSDKPSKVNWEPHFLHIHSMTNISKWMTKMTPLREPERWPLKCKPKWMPQLLLLTKRELSNKNNSKLTLTKTIQPPNSKG